jgi:alcohol dehydrogenase class IV
MEAIWNRSANPISDAVAVRAIALIPTALRGALEAPDGLASREALLSGSLLAGLAISNTRTALAHSISYPLTAELGLPHGIACSLTLPELLLAVGDQRPDRAELIVTALGCSSTEDGAQDLRRLFAVAGTADVVRRHVPSAEVLRSLKGGYIAPGRAENFILPVDEAWATALLARSLGGPAPS